MRIRRLGYFDDVNIETPPVAGTPDQADVEVTVTEKATGNLLAGVGYSSSEKFVFNASMSQQNIFGSGNALTAAINTSSINRMISLTFTEPYYTVDGVSRTLEVYQRNTDPVVARRSRRTSRRRCGAAVSFGIPITRDRYDQPRASATSTPSSTLFAEQPAVLLPVRRGVRSTSRTAIILSGGWSRDTRDDILYPTQGVAAELAGVEVGLPFGDLTYYKANYLHAVFLAGLWRLVVLMLRGDVGYADGYGGKPLPFYKVFYAGGVGSVRGYETALARSARHRRQSSGRQAQDRRQRRAVLSASSRATSRCARACSWMPARSPAFRPGRHRRELREGRREIPVFGRRRARLELAGRAAQIQLRVAAERREPGDQIQSFQFQVGSVF